MNLVKPLPPFLARFHLAAAPLSAAGAARQATTPFPGPRGARLQRGAAGALRCDGRAEGSFDENVVLGIHSYLVR